MSYEYDPLKWPPDLALAQLHLKCTRAGIDNPQGNECPCCHRLQKLKNSKWPSRDIIKDFKNYGGGVPAYFSLLAYFGVVFGILTVVIVAYHLYVLEMACLIIDKTGEGEKCTDAFKALHFCNSAQIYNTLYNNDHQIHAQVFSYLQLVAYILLVGAAIGIKIWLQHLNYHKIAKQQKVLSRFALIIKNVPRGYQMQDLKRQILDVDSKIQILELFYVRRTADYQKNYRQIFDLYYQLKYQQELCVNDPTDKNKAQLKKLQQRYLQLSVELESQSNYLNVSSKRAIVVFNTIQQKQLVHDRLKINEWSKFVYYTMKMLGITTKNLNFFSQKIAQPEEVHWNYIGESSTFKTKVRFQTTLIGFGFMLLSFGLFYFPTVKIDALKVKGSNTATILGLIISLLIIVLAIIYRIIIIRLMPKRRPSSRLAQSLFIVLSTVVFHYFFYLVTPALYYYFVRDVPSNEKLKQLFLAVVTFIGMTVLVAALDMKYLLYNRKKKKLLFQQAYSHQYCQQRLHEQLTPPSFPIEFKLMVILNIFSFNAFYIFQLPYLLFLFLIVLIILYWIDKRYLYKHYKMQAFLSIQLQLKIQKTYIILFLLCLSVGYVISAVHVWQRYLTIGICILGIIINFTLNYQYKKKKNQQSTIKKTSTLKAVVKASFINPTQSFHHNLMQNDLKSSFLINPQFSQKSLGSLHIQYSYQQIYQQYLNQFKNKEINDMLAAKEKYLIAKHSQDQSQGEQQRKRKESQLVGLEHQALVDGLLDQREPDHQSASSFKHSEEHQQKQIKRKEVNADKGVQDHQPILDQKPVHDQQKNEQKPMDQQQQKKHVQVIQKIQDNPQ